MPNQKSRTQKLLLLVVPHTSYDGGQNIVDGPIHFVETHRNVLFPAKDEWK